jgi:hypothetical protein
MTTFFWAVGILLACFLLYFLPFAWWQKPPSKQRDRIIGKLLPFMTISPRVMMLRMLFLSFLLFLYVQAMLFLPVIAGFFMVLIILFGVLERLRGRSAQPVTGLVLLLIVASVFLVGFLAPVRAIPIAGYLLLGRPAGNSWEMLTIGPAWMTWDSIIGLCGIFGVASWMVIDSIWRFRQARDVDNLATSPIDSLAMGLVEVKGIVRPLQGEAGPPPVTVIYGSRDYFAPEQRIEQFRIDDGTGSVTVDARDCRVRAGWISEITSLFGVREIVLTKHVERNEFTDTDERSLRYGDQVYVIGNAERQASGEPVIRPASRSGWNEVLWKTFFGAISPPKGKDIHDVFFLTDGTEQEAKARILKGFRTVLLWGVVWIAASSAIIWAAQQPWRLAPPLDSWRNAWWRGPDPNPNPGIIDATRNQRLFRFERYIKTVGPHSFDQIPALIEAAGYRDYRFYDPAISALMRMMPAAEEQIRPVLPVLVGHLDPCERNAVSLQTTILAVSRFGADAVPAVPKLMQALQCGKTSTYEVPGEVIRMQAARALGSIGPAAREAVPLLRAALNDAAPYVRGEAERALARIEGSPPN